MPHTDGGFGLTPNTIAQTSAKVDMTTRFLGLVGSLSADKQNFWIPNQEVHDPDTWTTPHLLQLKREYEILVDEYGCVVQEMFTVQDPPAPPSDTLVLPPLKCLYEDNGRIQERPQPGDSRPVLSPSKCTISRVPSDVTTSEDVTLTLRRDFDDLLFGSQLTRRTPLSPSSPVSLHR